MDETKEEIELVEGVAAAAGAAAEQKVASEAAGVWDERTQFVADGHRVITEGLAAAHRVADQHPGLPLKSLVASIEHTLRSFLSHLVPPAAPETAEPEPATK